MKILEKRLKWFLLLLIRILFPREAHSHFLDDWRSFERILVFRLDNRLGNCILILPLVQAIKKSLPYAQIDVLMASRFTEIYDNHPGISHVIPYDQQYLLRRPWRFFMLIRQLKKTGYDVVFSSSNPNTLSLSQAIFARIITEGRSLGFKWRESEHLYTDVVPGRTDVFYGDAQVDLWRYFDAEAQYHPPQIYFAGQNYESTTEEALIWIGARGGKILPEPLVTRFTSLLGELGIKFSYAAGPSDKDIVKKYTSEIAQKVRHLSGNLQETVDFLKRFKLLIMPDTGPMHLAAALDIPLIQIFVESNAVWYGYQDERRIIYEAKDDPQNMREFIVKHIGDRKTTEQGKILQ